MLTPGRRCHQPARFCSAFRYPACCAALRPERANAGTPLPVLRSLDPEAQEPGRESHPGGLRSVREGLLLVLGHADRDHLFFADGLAVLWARLCWCLRA